MRCRTLISRRAYPRTHVRWHRPDPLPFQRRASSFLHLGPIEVRRFGFACSLKGTPGTQPQEITAELHDRLFAFVLHKSRVVAMRTSATDPNAEDFTYSMSIRVCSLDTFFKHLDKVVG